MNFGAGGNGRLGSGLECGQGSGAVGKADDFMEWLHLAERHGHVTLSALMFLFLAGIKFMFGRATFDTADDSLFLITSESGEENLLVGL